MTTLITAFDGMSIVQEDCQSPNQELNYSTLCPLSLKNLPEECKPERVLRCVELLEHAVTCADALCSEGEGCVKTKRVLAHHVICWTFRSLVRNKECVICAQLMALCQNHSYRCQVDQGKGCSVPHCCNRKIPQPGQKLLDNDSQNKVRNEYRFVTQMLLKSSRLPSSEERMTKMRQLLRSNPYVTTKLIRLILARKRHTDLTAAKNSVGLVAMGKPIGIIKPISQVNQKPSRGQCYKTRFNLLKDYKKAV